MVLHRPDVKACLRVHDVVFGPRREPACSACLQCVPSQGLPSQGLPPRACLPWALPPVFTYRSLAPSPRFPVRATIASSACL